MDAPSLQGSVTLLASRRRLQTYIRPSDARIASADNRGHLFAGQGRKLRRDVRAGGQIRMTAAAVPLAITSPLHPVPTQVDLDDDAGLEGTEMKLVNLAANTSRPKPSARDEGFSLAPTSAPLAGMRIALSERSALGE